MHNVAVVGAGIGGLTAALFCLRAGMPVCVYEQSREIRELGVGINLLPHAVRELDKLGLLDELLANGVETAALSYYNKHGQLIWSEPRGRAAGYKWPQISIHRGKLQGILLRTAIERLGEDRVRTNCRLVNFDGSGSQAVASFVDGGGAALPEVRADVLIAADGIHSTARKILYPDEGDPLYAGIMLWRGTTIAESYLGGRTMIMAGHPDQKFVCYPLSAPDSSGRQLINWIADIRREQTLGREDWNRPGNAADILPAYDSWRFDWLDVPGIISRAGGMFEFPMVDRDPLPQWNFGRMTLLGDAAHPMYPIGSNGSTQAIRDASAIVDALVESGDVLAALARYQACRLPATAAIVRSNRQLGPELVMQIAESRAPEGFSDIENVIPRAELEEVAGRYKKLAGFSVDTLNANLSILDEAGA